MINKKDNKFLLACVGNANDISTFSNVPYYILKTGIKQNLFDKYSGLDLQPEKLLYKKIFWNLSRYLKGYRHGGFQYSEFFARELMSQVDIPNGSSILSLQPILPAWPWPNHWSVSLYIDVSTRQNFEHYGAKKRLSKQIQKKALLQEKNACLNAKHIICMTNWCANSLIEEHNINPNKIKVVLPGANLDETKLDLPFNKNYPKKPSKNDPLRIGFLGKDWIRKGGPFLLEIAKELKKKNIPVLIRVIGPDHNIVPKESYVNYLGKIDKSKSLYKFVNELRSWHFGSLFSKADGFGISNFECMILGVPVIANRVGGIPEAFPYPECGKLFEPNRPPEEVAEWIKRYTLDYSNYLKNRKKLSNLWNEFTWTNSIRKISDILRS
tara:strand:- start:14566 stop:15711 length:1146 start_codon:yes stop_codon:yes gene_type:complete